MPEESFSYAMLSDPGRVRRRNEDACEADGERGIFVVCDGVGGAAGGEVASRLAASTFVGRMRAAGEAPAVVNTGPEAALREAVNLANETVYRQSREQAGLFGMATTMVAMLFEPGGTEESAGMAWLVNVGDSRCYRLRGEQFEQMTQDHSLVGEQVRSGLMTRAQAEVSPVRNVITRAVGSESGVEPDIQGVAAWHGDLFLLASDGLTRDLSDADVAGVLMARDANGTEGAGLDTLCAELVRRANERGGGDNITCLLVRVR